MQLKFNFSWLQKELVKSIYFATKNVYVHFIIIIIIIIIIQSPLYKAGSENTISPTPHNQPMEGRR